MAPSMTIVGICRFSMIGQGDWKAYRKIDPQNLERVYAEKEAELFDEDRMETRLRTFEKLTLASLKAQNDRDFLFLVVSSDRMPPAYQARLRDLCAACQNVVLRFVPPMHVVDAQKDILAELNLIQRDCLQFRLDDDDALSKRFIERLRLHGQALWAQYPAFSISFPNLIYSVIDGDTQGLYRWFNPFLGIGLAVRNAKRSVYGYAHYKIPQAIIGLTDPSICNLVTHHGMNDTPRHRQEILKKRGMVKSSLEELQPIVSRNFDFLSDEGRALAGLAE